MCNKCPTGTVARNAGSVVCTQCRAGEKPHKNATDCACAEETYNSSVMDLRCYNSDYTSRQVSTDPNECRQCPHCVDCSKVGSPVVKTGYRLRNGEEMERLIFKCPYAESCLSVLVSDAGLNQSCSDGHTGVLCQSCLDNWSKTPSGSCFACNSGDEWQWIVLTILLAIVVVVGYCAMHKYLVRKRRKSEREAGTAGTLFDCMDADGSGTITCEELRYGLAELGMPLSETTAYVLLETIDVDGSGDVDRYEFEAWMAHRVSRTQHLLTVFKILIGFVQVIKDAPRLMNEEHTFPSSWRFLQMFGSVDLTLFIPCIGVDYYSKFVGNAFITPSCLLGLVALSWALDDPPSTAGLSPSALAQRLQTRRTSQKTDFYLAFFLSCE